MSVELTHDLWQELKRYISVVDRNEAADIVVNILIDNDYDITDIRQAFKSDSDVKRALQHHVDDADDDEEEEFDDHDSDEFEE
jgi:hypothetical protein